MTGPAGSPSTSTGRRQKEQTELAPAGAILGDLIVRPVRHGRGPCRLAFLSLSSRTFAVKRWPRSRTVTRSVALRFADHDGWRSRPQLEPTTISPFPAGTYCTVAVRARPVFRPEVVTCTLGRPVRSRTPTRPVLANRSRASSPSAIGRPLRISHGTPSGFAPPAAADSQGHSIRCLSGPRVRTMKSSRLLRIPNAAVPGVDFGVDFDRSPPERPRRQPG